MSRRIDNDRAAGWPDLRLRWWRRLSFRIYLAVLGSLALSAILVSVVALATSASGRTNVRMAAMSSTVARLLPPATAPAAQQAEELQRLGRDFQVDLALYARDGVRVASAGSFSFPRDARAAGQAHLGPQWVYRLPLPDGRLLAIRAPHPDAPMWRIAGVPLLIALAVALVAYPLVRRITARLEQLQSGVEAFGGGQLSARVDEDGRDEIARLARSFNHSAERIEHLVDAQKRLLAHASHELRSPLARLRMAVELSTPVEATPLTREIERNIAELDALIDEILLASRLDVEAPLAHETIDLAALAAEECARVDAELLASPMTIVGDARLLRRMLRNLLENAKRYGAGTPIRMSIAEDSGNVAIDVEDGGPGIPEDQREAIFAPFHRVPGRSEREGGVGLGLSLVRQIARAHGGDVQCTSREGGGTRFRVRISMGDDK